MRTAPLLLLLSGILLLSTPALASSVWRVSHAGNHLYIGGTVHALGRHDHPLPSAYDTGLNDAQTLVFETDFAELGSPATQLKMMEALTYDDGTTLRKVLTPETFADLESFLSSRGLSVENFLSFTPSGMTMILTSMEMQRLGMDPQFGVDLTLAKKGAAVGLNMEALETVDQQIAYISTLGQGDEDNLISYTLQDISLMSTMMRDLVEAWRTGDLTKLEAIALAEMREDYPQVHRVLVVERNQNWMPSLMGYLQDKPVEFVLVGALHLAGDEGLINQLKLAGYQVEQLD